MLEGCSRTRTNQKGKKNTAPSSALSLRNSTHTLVFSVLFLSLFLTSVFFFPLLSLVALDSSELSRLRSQLEKAQGEASSLKKQLEVSQQAKQKAEAELLEAEKQLQLQRQTQLSQPQDSENLQVDTMKASYESLRSLHESFSQQHLKLCETYAYDSDSDSFKSLLLLLLLFVSRCFPDLKPFSFFRVTLKEKEEHHKTYQAETQRLTSDNRGG